MILLSIETSCDETALSIVEAQGGLKQPQFKILANNVASQVKIHEKYGGVFPMLAKREHSKNLIPLLRKTLKEASFYKLKVKSGKLKVESEVKNILEREKYLLEQFLDFIPEIEVPPIDTIAVTYGPGLEPALWVGLNFAKALCATWDKKLIPINHMEGHIFSSLLPEEKKKYDQLKVESEKLKEFETLRPVAFPALALLISGGHTELVLVKKWMDYKILGETLDDAVGEAFDKVARMLGLPYPGGPALSALAESAQTNAEIRLPRPMISSPDYNFSFSGLKTAVLYTIKKIPELTNEIKTAIAKEFQDAVTEVLITKTMKAVEEYNIQTLLIGGGVAANKQIRKAFKNLVRSDPTRLKVYFPRKDLTTDNSIMIAMAGYFRAELPTASYQQLVPHLTACGTLKL